MGNPYPVRDFKPREPLNNGHSCPEPEGCCDDIRNGHTYHIFWNYLRHYSPLREILLPGGSLIRDSHVYYICSDTRAKFFIEKGYQYLGVGVVHKD